MDEDDYWNQSASTSFSFEDEDQNYLQSPSTSKTVNEKASRIQLKTIQRKISTDTISEFGEESQFTNSHIPLNILISEQNLQKVIEEQSMGETQLPKGTTAEQELKILRRRTQEKFHPPSVGAMINRIIVKKPFSLECYRSLIEKESLLDETVRSRCGDAILTVILFLTTTLDRSIWIQMLRTRPVAINHFLNYLIKMSHLNEWTFLLNQLGKYSQLALLQFDTLMKSLCQTNVEHKRETNEKINEIFELYFKKGNVHPILTNLVTNYQILLDWQKNHPAPRTDRLILNTIQLNNSSVLESLYYACIYHKWNDSLCRYNPQTLVDMENVCQAQYEWIVLNEMGYSQKWRNLESFFEKKTWHNLKGKSFSMNIPLDMAILQLHRMNAPIATLNYFLAHISDARQRLLLAKRMAATKSIVDALLELKERNELEAFIDTIEPNTDVRFYAEGKLRNLQK